MITWTEIRKITVLLKKYQERFPTATLDGVKKKINSLRTNYRKKLKKVNDSYKSGAGLEDIYQSHLWYFNEMHFPPGIKKHQQNHEVLYKSFHHQKSQMQAMLMIK